MRNTTIKALLEGSTRDPFLLGILCDFLEDCGRICENNDLDGSIVALKIRLCLNKDPIIKHGSWFWQTSDWFGWECVVGEDQGNMKAYQLPDWIWLTFPYSSLSYSYKHFGVVRWFRTKQSAMEEVWFSVRKNILWCLQNTGPLLVECLQYKSKKLKQEDSIKLKRNLVR